jgi:hypothetical protein
VSALRLRIMGMLGVWGTVVLEREGSPREALLVASRAGRRAWVVENRFRQRWPRISRALAARASFGVAAAPFYSPSDLGPLDIVIEAFHGLASIVKVNRGGS